MVLTISFVLNSIFWIIAQDRLPILPIKLDEEINSPAQESQPFLSPGGDTLYFNRSMHQENVGGSLAGQEIWFSTRHEGGWTAAQNNLKNLNTGENNAVAGISAGGGRLFLINTYSPPVRWNRAIAYSEQVDGEWISPRELDLVMDIKGSFYGFYMAPSEDVLIISMNSKATHGQEDLYVSLKVGENWSKPEHMGNVLNTEGYEISPFLSVNKDSLYFSSTGHGGLGDADIFVSKRIGEGWQEWSAPVNLGEPFNSTAFDGYYFERNEEAYFSSDREGDHDIFGINISKLDSYDPKSEIVISEPVSLDSLSTLADKEPNVANKENSSDKPVNKEISKSWKIYYGFDSYALDAEGKKVLDQLLEEVKSHENAQITIRGYSDSIGPEAYNLTLSRKRAEQVMEYLQRKGLSNSKMTLLAKGEQEVIDNDSLDKREKNRRAEVVVKIF